MDLTVTMQGRAPEKNFPLLEKIYDHILLNPNEWDQMHWGSTWSGIKKGLQINECASRQSCGTAFCVAGHAVHMSRPEARFIFNDAERPTKEKGAVYQIGNEVEFPDGDTYEVVHLARMELGLTTEESTWLFHPENSLRMLRGIIDWWLAGNDGANELLTEAIWDEENAD